jgi:hypothetical protein
VLGIVTVIGPAASAVVVRGWTTQKSDTTIVSTELLPRKGRLMRGSFPLPEIKNVVVDLAIVGPSENVLVADNNTVQTDERAFVTVCNVQVLCVPTAGGDLIFLAKIVRV